MARLPADDKEFTTETREVTPANMLIKIESFSLLSKYGIRNYESREFEAGDYKWRLIIYPDGDENVNEGDYVSVYLSVAGTSSLPVDWDINAIFSIFLYNQTLDNYLCFRGKARRFHALNSKCGFSKMISKKILTDPNSGYLVDDNCVFGAAVFVIPSQRVIESVCVLKVNDPYKRNWKISNFSRLGNVWSSEVFSTGSHRWKIELYPDGNESEKGRNVSVYLESVDSNSFDPHEKLKADFCISIKNPFYTSRSRSVNLSHWFTSSEQKWGLPDFISIAEMHDLNKGFLSADCCYLEAEISVQVVAIDTDRPTRRSIMF